MDKISNCTPLTISLLREKGFIIPRHPIFKETNVIIYGKVSQIAHKKIFGFINLRKKCPPIAVYEINNKEYFLIYNPYPQFITKVYELMRYCKMSHF